jgi:hypothetical protein
MDNFFGSVMMFITKEKKIEKEQNGRMELCGPQNTRKTGNEREKCLYSFLKLLLPRMEWKFIHHQQQQPICLVYIKRR